MVKDNTNDDNNTEQQKKNDEYRDRGFEDLHYNTNMNDKIALFFVEAVRNRFADGTNAVWTNIARAAYYTSTAGSGRPVLIAESKVHSANLLHINKASFDIALAVPANYDSQSDGPAEDDQLVQLLVTVPFPQMFLWEEQNTENTDVLETLIHQVRILDGHATDKLASIAAKHSAAAETTANADTNTNTNRYYYEQKVIEQRKLEQLQHDEDEDNNAKFSKPNWWQPIAVPTCSYEFVQDCQSLQTLVNEEEFEDEVRALFVQHTTTLEDSARSSSSLVLRAAVASIGTSGIFLKGRILKMNTNNDAATERVLGVAVPYLPITEENTAVPPYTTIENIREGVIALIESVIPLAKPILPPRTTPTKATVNDEEEDTTVDTGSSSFLPYNERVKMQTEAAAAAETNAKASVEVPSRRGTHTTRQQQPKSENEEAILAAKYAAIDDIGDRAFAILKDLEMI